MNAIHQEGVERLRSRLGLLGFNYFPPKSGRDDKKHCFSKSVGPARHKTAVRIWLKLFNEGFGSKERYAASIILVGNGWGELWKFKSLAWSKNPEGNLKRLFAKAKLASRFLGSQIYCPTLGHGLGKGMRPILVPDGRRHMAIAWHCCHAGCQSTFRLESRLSNAIMVQTDKAFLLELATQVSA